MCQFQPCFQYPFQRVSKGLGQLGAYVHAEEGVAFQMDIGLFWDSLGSGYQWAIQGVLEKMESGKFWIIRVSSGMIMLRDWIGKYLAAMDVGADPNTFPIQPVPYSDHPSLRFEVFHKDNKVAFRAYNGLFLARMFRGFHTIEAAKFFADDTCCFRPLIGDLIPPTFKLLRMVRNDLSGVRCQHFIITKRTFLNLHEVPVQHTFSLKWETHCTDQTLWNRMWGLGLPFSCWLRVEEVAPILKYTQDNERTVYVPRYVYHKQTKEVEVPPKTKAVACLYVFKDSTATVPFTAHIQKVKSNGDVVTFREHGSWTGLAYRNVHMEVKLESIRESCTPM